MVKRGKRYDEHAGLSHLSDWEIMKLSKNEIDSRYKNALSYDEVKKIIKKSFGGSKKKRGFATFNEIKNQDLLKDSQRFELDTEDIPNSEARALKDTVANQKTTDEERAFIFNLMFELQISKTEDEWNEKIVEINKKWSEQIESAHNKWSGIKKNKLPFFMDKDNPIDWEKGHSVLTKAIKYIEHDQD
jgi:hypothetical protein